MTYTVKEIFYTLQGEERTRADRRSSAASPAATSGRGEEDRASAICNFCDTDFFGVGPDGGKFRSADDLADAVASRWPSLNGHGQRFVVCTGGEPSSNSTRRRSPPFTHAASKSRSRPTGHSNLRRLDWVCVSPKAGAETILRRGDELKLVYPQEGAPRVVRGR